MADNAPETIAKASVGTAEVKAPDTADNLPPITKEPADTAEAAMAPLVPAEPATTESAASSSDTATKPEAPAAAEAQENVANKLSESGAPALEKENPYDAAPDAEPQPATTETVASGVEPSAPVDSSDKAAEPPKPVSLEEIRDEDLPTGKASDAKEQADEVRNADATAPVATTSVETTETPAVETASAKNGDGPANNKRKADVADDAAKPNAGHDKDEHVEPPEKKHKTNGATTNGAARKPGRPRKDKTAAVPVGKTARKTRSQGAAE
ncbi:hypothetical protein F5Y10DRAFT_240955 [Nemania abortiva]|nr:hypothetical protein F5Y10DRAFT_240955 [Nemania abortiva]